MILYAESISSRTGAFPGSADVPEVECRVVKQSLTANSSHPQPFNFCSVRCLREETLRSRKHSESLHQVRSVYVRGPGFGGKDILRRSPQPRSPSLCLGATWGEHEGVSSFLPGLTPGASTLPLLFCSQVGTWWLHKFEEAGAPEPCDNLELRPPWSGFFSSP